MSFGKLLCKQVASHDRFWSRFSICTCKHTGNVIRTHDSLSIKKKKCVFLNFKTFKLNSKHEDIQKGLSKATVSLVSVFKSDICKCRSKNVQFLLSFAVKRSCKSVHRSVVSPSQVRGQRSNSRGYHTCEGFSLTADLHAGKRRSVGADTPASSL